MTTMVSPTTAMDQVECMRENLIRMAENRRLVSNASYRFLTGKMSRKAYEEVARKSQNEISEVIALKPVK